MPSSKPTNLSVRLPESARRDLASYHERVERGELEGGELARRVRALLRELAGRTEALAQPAGK